MLRNKIKSKSRSQNNNYSKRIKLVETTPNKKLIKSMSRQIMILSIKSFKVVIKDLKIITIIMIWVRL